MDSQSAPLSILPFIPFIVSCLVVGLVVWMVRGYLRDRREGKNRDVS
jgi:hypothetical protein